MPRGKKRKLNSNDASSNQNLASSKHYTPVKKDLLQQHYPRVCTLREYVLSSLPDTSRIRRKKIAALGSNTNASETETQLSRLLDTALVGTCQSTPRSDAGASTWEQWLSFSQNGDESYVTISKGIATSFGKQSEIVDFVIWLLFSREKAGPWPKHVLCDGFRKSAREDQSASSTIPGIYSYYPNFHVKALREAPWPHLLALLGQAGEKVMIDLLSECSVFLKVDAGLDNYIQLTGIPLSEVDIKTPTDGPKPQTRKPSDITLVRSRIFYAKPTTTAKGLVHAGFKHIHALNRYPYTPEVAGTVADDQQSTEVRQKNEANTVKLMMHIFPRQFGLHNVFTSAVDTSQTAQKFQDYTFREDEIKKQMVADKRSTEKRLPKLPKRLRGATHDLVQRLQVLHTRCSYFELLRHYCPTFLDGPHGPHGSRKKKGDQEAPMPSIPTASRATQADPRPKRRTRRHPADNSVLPEHNSVVELACPVACVSAFCQAALSKILPDSFWGSEKLCHNKAVFLRKIDQFIKLRRFEMVSLHDIAQDFKVTELYWLVPPVCEGQKTSQTDRNKRYELFYEFLYYVFDSLLIPLIRSNFYVTESNTHRFQVFYFRHDVWRLVAEPSLSNLKEGMFEEVNPNEAKRIVDSRRLGFSQLRLLPKGTKLRPIMNLRRRQMPDKKNSKVLGPSINSILKPIHTALKFERIANSHKLGSALFAVGDIYERLRAFKETLTPNRQHTFYFAKLDVKAAFDTIPQSSVLKLMASVPSQNRYLLTKHTEVKPGVRLGITRGEITSKPVRRWHSTAMPVSEPIPFLDRLESGMGTKKKNTVFVDSAVLQVQETRGLMALLSEHVGRNIVKIGKKYYRQKKGIPQGSILSTFLCNYFYADLETQHLDFLNESDSLLLRLIDDFLLITLDKDKAIRFVETMHQGVPEYGVEVGRDKTLVNFDMEFEGGRVRKLDRGSKFPYCGTFIDCKTLEITKDRRSNKDIDVSASMTVDFGRSPGQSFQRKVLNSFKYQSHLMFFDTEHNSVGTVLDSLRGAFSETALKMWAYLRCLSASTRLSVNVVIGTIKKVVDVAFLILTSKWRKMRFKKYACEIRKAQVMATGYFAFLEVLGRRQTGYGDIIAWLKEETARLAMMK